MNTSIETQFKLPLVREGCLQLASVSQGHVSVKDETL